MIDNDIFPPALKAHYHTLGCKLNFAETASVSDAFISRGVNTAAEGETPDLIIINTCSVTAEADRKCRSVIRSFNRKFPKAAIFVTGCYAQLKADEIRAIPGVTAVAGINDKLAIVDMAHSHFMGQNPDKAFPAASDLREFMPSCSRGERTRYFLKVQDGCDYWCTYCTIPKARGRSRSGTIEQLVAQAREAAAAGGKEIVLTGVNIGDFGHGREDNFLDLCRALDEVEGIERYRISSIEPNLLTDELIDFVFASKHFMPHFHIPLQNGSDEVLKLMRRRYDSSLFASKIARIRQARKDAFIGVDLIVGARGETPERFEESRAFVEGLDISHLHVFTYSERPGTKALDIEYAVEPAEKHRRSGVMMQISADKHRRFAESMLGQVRPVLLEHVRPGIGLEGFTDNYLRVRTQLGEEYQDTIVNVRLDSLLEDGETILGTLV